jgi:hypothetical protein
MPEPGMGNKAEASISTGPVGGGSRPGRNEPGQRANYGIATSTGKLSQEQFNRVTGRTATNPYGYAAPTAIGRFFANTFGPENLDYSGITPGGTQGIATLNALALDVFNNPYAETNILGQETGANPDLGIARSGVQPGQYTSMGTAKSYRQDLSPMGRVAAGLASLFGPFGSGYAISEGTKVTGIEDTVPISARTGQPLSEAGTGTLNFLGDIMTGGQSQYIGGKTKGMVDRMMDFFTPNQQTTDIQPSDVAVNPMSAYLEAGRQPSGVPQLGVTSYGSPMAQVTAPATTNIPSQFSGNTEAIEAMMNAPTRSYASTPNRADMMAFNFGPTASSQVAVSPGQAVSPTSSLTTTKAQEQAISSSRQAAALSNAPTILLESSYPEASPAEQAMIAAELQQRAAEGNEYAESLVAVLGLSGAPKSVQAKSTELPYDYLTPPGMPYDLTQGLYTDELARYSPTGAGNSAL